MTSRAVLARDSAVSASICATLPSARGLENSLLTLLYLGGSLGPGLAAIIVTGVLDGRRGMRELLGRLLRWRVGIRWYLVVLLLPAAIRFSAFGLQILLGGQVPEFDLLGVLGVFLIQLFFLSLVTGALGEEIGWRGFALPRLQERQNPLSASLFLGTLWALWHLPTFLVVGSGQSMVPMVWLWFEIFGSTFLWTWVCNNTQGSLLMAFLLHAALNATSNVLLLAAMAAGYATSYAQASSVLAWMAVVILLTATRGRFGAPPKTARPAPSSVS